MLCKLKYLLNALLTKTLLVADENSYIPRNTTFKSDDYNMPVVHDRVRYNECIPDLCSINGGKCVDVTDRPTKYGKDYKGKICVPTPKTRDGYKGWSHFTQG